MILDIIKFTGSLVLEGYFYGFMMMFLAIPLGLIIKGIIMIL